MNIENDTLIIQFRNAAASASYFHCKTNNGPESAEQYVMKQKYIIDCIIKPTDSDVIKSLRFEGNKTLLHVACEYNCPDVIEYLVRTVHMDVSQPDFFGNTPLHVACEYKKYAAVEKILSILVLKGNDCVSEVLSKTNKNGETALFKATELNVFKENEHDEATLKASEEITDILLHYAYICYVPSSSKNNNNNRTMKQMVDHKNRFGDTALHYACLHGNFKVAKKLVKNYDADIHIINIRNESVLQYVMRYSDNCLKNIISSNRRQRSQQQPQQQQDLRKQQQQQMNEIRSMIVFLKNKYIQHYRKKQSAMENNSSIQSRNTTNNNSVDSIYPPDIQRILLQQERLSVNAKRLFMCVSFSKNIIDLIKIN